MRGAPMPASGNAQLFRRIGTFGCDRLSDHKFKIGELVNYTSRGPRGTSGVHKITQLLPPERDEPQYRIKSENEPHERVVKESTLTGVA
jgi:hypothetical protein